MKTKKYRRNVRRLTKKHKSKHRSKKVGGADQADQTNQTNPSTPERQPTHTGPGGPVKRTPDPHAEELRKERERKEKAFMEALENKRQIEKYNDELTKLVISSSDQHTEPPSSIHDVVMPENPSATIIGDKGGVSDGSDDEKSSARSTPPSPPPPESPKKTPPSSVSSERATSQAHELATQDRLTKDDYLMGSRRNQTPIVRRGIASGDEFRQIKEESQRREKSKQR